VAAAVSPAGTGPASKATLIRPSLAASLEGSLHLLHLGLVRHRPRAIVVVEGFELDPLLGQAGTQLLPPPRHLTERAITGIGLDFGNSDCGHLGGGRLGYRVALTQPSRREQRHRRTEGQANHQCAPSHDREVSPTSGVELQEAPPACCRIQINKADSAGNQITAKTNTYTYTGTDPSDCADWTAVVNWPSTSRQTLVGTTPLDIIGVRLIVEHDWMTGFPPFTGSFDVDEATIIRLEPEAYE
jgi:hypothetical protein